jgi:hypothetical protein
MDGDLAPMVELVKLRKKHHFLLIVDDVSHFYILMLMEAKETVWSLSFRHVYWD